VVGPLALCAASLCSLWSSCNAQYWFRRVGAHPVLKLLAEQAPALGYRYTDASAFVDFCERVRDSGTPEEELARKVQQLEWRLLFDYCYRAALGGRAPSP
jgi:hypothetical protein